jgi:hypothetical protein
MNEPLPTLMENSIQITWDYLWRTGELGDPEVAHHFAGFGSTLGSTWREAEADALK